MSNILPAKKTWERIKNNRGRSIDILKLKAGSSRLKADRDWDLGIGW